MPRKPRFAPPGYFLHLTQRGNYRQRTFFSRHDHDIFLEILGRHAEVRQVDIVAYCLMSNHFHLIARGHQPDSISRFMQGLNGQYAQYIHGRLGRQGRFWQTRFYSCVLSDAHLVAALRYVELNPVRAELVSTAEDYPWSSAAIHIGRNLTIPEWLDVACFDHVIQSSDWRARLAAGQTRQERAAIRFATRTEAPLGDAGFIAKLESDFNVILQPKATNNRPAKKPPAAQSFGGVGGAALASGE